MQDKDINQVIKILRKAVTAWPAPALAHYSHTPFTTLISCILSLRTQDRTTIEASERLYRVADTPEQIAALSRKRLERLIYPVSFFRVKAETLREVSRDLIDRFGGAVPDTIDQLLTLKGVGRKTANIVVTLAYGKPGIAVDTHVHRIVNRLGYIRSRHADQTELLLRDKLPRRYWIVLNDLLVAYGQNHCTPSSPHCSTCLLDRYCDRVGVDRFR